MANTDIVLRAPSAATNIILSSTAGASPGLWINTEQGSKRAIAIYQNVNGVAKLLTSLSINVNGVEKDMVIE